MNRIFALPVAFGLMLAAGCSATPPSSITQYVDDRSGESLTHATEPTRFVAERPALSRVGKDYLYAAPVRVSGFDAPTTYLWFAVGSSVDRRITGAPIPEVRTIVLLVDEMPMTFDLVSWNEVTASEPFELGVEHYTSYGARVTDNQLRRISAAETLNAYVANGENRSPTFAIADGLYEDWAGL
jgi:hypothetical protein